MMRYLAAFLLLLGAASGNAQMPYSPDERLRGELQIMGIDPTQVDWMAIDALCAPLRAEAEKHRLCIKQKVLDKKDFQQEAGACRKVAAMPRPVMPRSPFGFNVPVGATPQQQYEIERRQHMAINLAKRRLEDPTIGDYSYETCMAKKRWRNPLRWQDGRKDQEDTTQ